MQETGPNILTPPKRRHPILKYLDCVASLFNLLLILAGILDYILLAIDFEANFANVSDDERRVLYYEAYRIIL